MRHLQPDKNAIRLVIVLTVIFGIYVTVYHWNGFAGGVLIATAVIIQMICDLKTRKLIMRHIDEIAESHILSIMLFVILQEFVQVLDMTLVSIVGGAIVSLTLLLVVSEIMEFW